MCFLNDKLRILPALIVLYWSVSHCSAEFVIFDNGQGAVSSSSTTLRGTSGLTHLGGNQYATIDDIDGTTGLPRFHQLQIDVNSSNGQITATSILSSTNIATGNQYEGIAWDGASGKYYVSSEADHSVRILDSSGAQVGSIAVPTIYQNAQPNKSLESLAYNGNTQQLYTANEERLTVDNNVNAVRLQEFTAGAGSGQYAYELENTRNTSNGFNGLSDIAVLPNGNLIAMERDLDLDSFNIAIRLYEIDLNSASDISAEGTLNGAMYTAVTKRSLLDPLMYPDGYFTTISNYEGLAVGPQLNDGSWTLLLGPSDDADNGFLIPETYLSFQLQDVSAVPEPGSCGLLFLVATSYGYHYRRKRRVV
ncbi:esterase-like activity of phytase family protein [Planctomycetaceae bacterium]|jgi:hypothetical protein|nr:esterase-like activity of phytase family protein [Planctomycetaceae bacterium]MDC0273846.1 esterase-like activity of phytase family protein [Planctomycetaceae bacterium]MDG2388264.1 esterase-like activity of phytase family protein [Planctomycetaceae bacterium]